MSWMVDANDGELYREDWAWLASYKCSCGYSTTGVIASSPHEDVLRQVMNHTSAYAAMAQRGTPWWWPHYEPDSEFQAAAVLRRSIDEQWCESAWVWWAADSIEGKEFGRG